MLALPGAQSLVGPPMAMRSQKRLMVFGSCAFVLALIIVEWLQLGIFNVLPCVLELPGEAGLRLHAAAAVGCLMFAAWGCWEPS